jgi:hypothetical protein
MDFIQRNLINERNNLQIELAKANILIAQLNELSNKTLGSYIKKASGVNTEPGGMSWSERNDIATLDNDAGRIADSGSDPSRVLKTLENRKQGIGRAVDQLTSRLVDAKYKRLVPKPMSEEAEYISSLENVIATIAESMNVSAADLYETYRITPARRDVLNKIESNAMRNASDAVGPDGEDFRASSIKKHDSAMSRVGRVQMIKMMGKPSDKRTHDEHPMHRYFPDDRAPNQLTDRALKADLTAERKREISNRPKKKKMK